MGMNNQCHDPVATTLGAYFEPIPKALQGLDVENSNTSTAESNKRKISETNRSQLTQREVCGL